MTKDYSELSDRVKNRVDEFAYRFLEKAINHLISVTPVKTGRMAGSWNATTNPQKAQQGSSYFKGSPKTNSKTKMLGNIKNMTLDAPTGAMVGPFRGFEGLKIQAGKPIYLINTARAPHNDFYYPSKVEDRRGFIKAAYGALPGIAEEAASEVKGE